MIPIPSDPFAISASSNSDSLRGPIFIPLDTEGLMGTKSFLFEGKIQFRFRIKISRVFLRNLQNSLRKVGLRECRIFKS